MLYEGAFCLDMPDGVSIIAVIVVEVSHDVAEVDIKVDSEEDWVFFMELSSYLLGVMVEG